MTVPPFGAGSTPSAPSSNGNACVPRAGLDGGAVGVYLYGTLYIAWTSPFARGFRVTFFDRTVWGAVIAFPVGVWIMGVFR